MKKMIKLKQHNNMHNGTAVLEYEEREIRTMREEGVETSLELPHSVLRSAFHFKTNIPREGGIGVFCMQTR